MANLKELSKKPELLCGGHRLCAGCGASIIVRQIMHAADRPVVVGCATGCLEVATTIYPYTAWKMPWIHNAFENVSPTISGVETAYRALKKKGKIKDNIDFIAIGGDGGMYDIGLQATSGVIERGHKMLIVCYQNGAYMNCLSLSSLIATKEGVKKITEVKEGEEVYAFDMKTHQLVLKECTGVFDNGIKDVYNLSTLHHSIKATSNHPFLVLKKNARGEENELVWKELKDVSPGDEIVVSRKLTPGKSARFDFRKAQKGDYKVNKINEVNIPRSSSPGLMKYLGLYVGDGWTRVNKAEVGFALPEKTEGRKSLLALHKDIFGNSLTMDETYISIRSINVAKFIEQLGFGQGAKNKKVPTWVFALPNEEKEAFVQGLMLSDGYKIGNSMRYVSASTELLETLRLLLQSMDYRVGKIHYQTKTKGTTCVKRKLLKDSTYGYICFSEKKPLNVLSMKRFLTQYKNRDFLIDNEHFAMEVVKEIKLIGKEPTLDLRVADAHNFIANGMVVHNTGIQRSSATPKGADTTTAPAGKAIPGKQQFKKDLTAIIAAHKIPYAAQASPGHWNDLVTKVQKALSTDGPSFLNIISPCPRGWRHPTDESIEMAKLAVDTCYWPLYEVIDGHKLRITVKPKEKKPVEGFLKKQGRFKHLFKKENKHIIKELQERLDADWQELTRKHEASELAGYFASLNK